MIKNMPLPLRRINPKQLGELLVERNMISQRQLIEALNLQKEKGGLVGEILVSLGFVTEEAIAQALTAQYGFPYLPLANYEIDTDIVRIVPYNVAKQYCLIAIDKIGSNLTVAMSNPLNLQAVDDIELLANSTVQIFISTTTDIKNAIERFYKK
ncbi:MAG: hypothetical protein COV72_05120 [Candidatus Omnitrophica bacterium CG11_big_fil_rev_8_21_14_0_20_42_13]|uniref:Type II secretion system protein GspE N-terminal domain-containing protein n=1 Tax=Candidatus Ghiorseimicrobium undicola TaxID=1974746 RepID=A0A2H0LZW5_9BACT|nr:MAG: hypothetical protein COV72_05120 [Candidatus Omnitrophica bacterium CG11_big_fil_rev_8_21_14_0_20_42_13]